MVRKLSLLIVPLALPFVKACQDVTTEALNPDCYGNVTWAMTVGIKTAPADYVKTPELIENSSREDFQCALYVIPAWGCPRPCTSTLPECQATFAPVCKDGTPQYKPCAWYYYNEDNGVDYCGQGRQGSVRRRDWGGDAHDNCSKTCGYCTPAPTMPPPPTAPPTAPPVTPPPSYPPTVQGVITTFVTADAPIGADVLEVTAQHMFNVGDIIDIGGQENEIIGFGSILLKNPLVAAVGPGTPVTLVRSAPSSSTTAEPSTSSSSSFPWWAWLLLGLLLVGCCIAVAFFAMSGNKSSNAPPKTKRALNKPKANVEQKTTPAPQVQAPAIATTMQQVPVATTAVPVPTAQPMYVQAQQYVQPQYVQQSYFQPMYTHQVQQRPMDATTAAALFDQLDTSRSGAITREQFGRLVG